MHTHTSTGHEHINGWLGGEEEEDLIEHVERYLAEKRARERESGGLKFETDSGIVRRCRECFRLRDSLGCSTISYVCLPHHDQLLRHIEQTPLLHRLILEQLVILYKPDWKEKKITYIRKRKTEMKQ